MFIIKILYGNRNFCLLLFFSLLLHSVCFTSKSYIQVLMFIFFNYLRTKFTKKQLKVLKKCAVKPGGEDTAFMLSNLAVRTWPLCCQTWRRGRGLCAVIAFFITLKYNAPSLITRLTSSLRNPMPPPVSLMLWKHTAATRLPAFCKEGQREALLLDLISKTPRRSLRNKMEPKNDWLQDPLLVDTSKEKNSR